MHEEADTTSAFSFIKIMRAGIVREWAQQSPVRSVIILTVSVAE